MRTILSLAVGFWLGRQLYTQYDKEQILKKEKHLKKKVKGFLEDEGFSEAEVKGKFDALWNS